MYICMYLSNYLTWTSSGMAELIFASQPSQRAVNRSVSDAKKQQVLQWDHGRGLIGKLQEDLRREAKRVETSTDNFSRPPVSPQVRPF